jgi:hypothetical protein
MATIRIEIKGKEGACRRPFFNYRSSSSQNEPPTRLAATCATAIGILGFDRLFCSNAVS